MSRRLKIMVIGDGGVGKTEFIRAILNQPFEKDYKPNDHIDVYNMQYMGVDVAFWDSAGQHFYTNQKENYNDADIVIYMFDVGSKISLKSLDGWYDQVVEVCGTSVPMVLVGNKCDLKDRAVTRDDVRKSKLNYMAYYEVSSKNNTNLDNPLLYTIVGFKEALGL